MCVCAVLYRVETLLLLFVVTQRRDTYCRCSFNDPLYMRCDTSVCNNMYLNIGIVVRRPPPLSGVQDGRQRRQFFVLNCVGVGTTSARADFERRNEICVRIHNKGIDLPIFLSKKKCALVEILSRKIVRKKKCI